MSDEVENRNIDDFWSQGYAQKMLKEALRECKTPARAIMRHARVLDLPRSYMPELRGIERLASQADDAQKRLQSSHRMCGLLFTILDLLRNNPMRTSPQEDCLDLLANALHKLCRKASSSFIGWKFLAKTDARRADPDIRSVITTMAYQFSIPESDFVTVGKYFFPDLDLVNLPEEPRKIFFNTYRFHGTPGKIVKSFTVIESPTKTVPTCFFYNFFVGLDSPIPKRSNGLVVPTPKAIFLTGGLVLGGGMKHLAIERLVQTEAPPEHLRGLTISFDDNETIVSARVVMRRTDAADHVKAGAGIYPTGKLPEIKPFIGELKNRIRFTLEKQVYLGTEKIDQAGIVEETRRALQAEGRKPLAYRDKKPFNPAADSEYTFNSALRIWTEGD